MRDPSPDPSYFAYADAANELPVADGTKGADEPDDYGRQLVQYWGQHMLDVTAAGKKVRDAIDLLDENKVPSHWLFGNHDNYLGDPKCTIKYTAKSSTKTLPERKAVFNTVSNLFMEHGHQRESNSDNKPTLPTALISGTDSTMGNFLTQAAFIRPIPIRGQFEGTAQSILASVEAGQGQRFNQIFAAADMFLTKKFGVYVMGHTHEACLTRVRVVTDMALTPIDKFKSGLPSDPKDNLWVMKEEVDSLGMGAIALQKMGEERGGTVVERGKERASVPVVVKWKALLGGGRARICLLDPSLVDEFDQAPGFPDPYGSTKQPNPLWLFLDPDAAKEGSSTFKEIPGGEYKAIYYVDDGVPALTATSRIKIYGISLEGNSGVLPGVMPARVGTSFVLTQAGVEGFAFKPDLVLRWSLDGSVWQEGMQAFLSALAEARKADPNAVVKNKQAYFGLFAPGDKSFKTRDATVKCERPWKYFGDIKGGPSSNPTTAWACGRWRIDLREYGGAIWDEMKRVATHDTWQIRAYASDPAAPAEPAEIARLQFKVKLG